MWGPHLCKNTSDPTTQAQELLEKMLKISSVPFCLRSLVLLERYGSSNHWLVHLVGILPMPWCVDVAKVHLWRGFAWDRHDRFALTSHQTHSKNASKSNTANQSISSIHENITLYLLKMVAGPHGSGSCHKNRTPSFDLLHKTKSISQSEPIIHCSKLPRPLPNYCLT